ncbi:hypothetical protein AAZX31_03G041600 [Glycine max]|uniref:Dirigent protein n=3 Tax=Glycine subgen. Soja TaxID=1462606 RepID=I1JL51_SOYBN|nr:dirigent protein 22 [Glycine max]XP_028224381.1 dirigent protein 22-like [Glycine soja]KAG5071115.1 hypothetical protein JHK86_006326 [Glycine max]KAH1068581.1 hypothetical protein GYH30_006239 [Glycine max]KRH65549.1 hypothetical protein GLYMA_03G044500v4 [Glycine max]RZC19085.1 Dirigent protein 3 [Glycine soja]|eukprot:XP_006576480.1 dirigent protein 22 [Glycine max]
MLLPPYKYPCIHITLFTQSTSSNYNTHQRTMATQFLKSLLLLSTLTLTISAEYTGFVGTIDPKSIGIKHKKTLSHFRFYWHEVFSGENPTSVRIIPALPKYNTTTTFGSVGIFDNALTVGPEVYSKVVGKAEGLFASTSQTQLDLLLIFNFALTQGKYNGSTITFTGRSPLSEKVRELPIVGGSGVFKFATGYIESRTLSFDPQTRNNTVQFDVYIYY